MEKLSSNDSVRRILVVGSPDIGKSVFGIFLLLGLMTEKRDLAYRPMTCPRTYYLSCDTVNAYEMSNTPWQERKHESLFDGNDKGGALDYGYLSHAFLLASLRSKNYNEFVEENCFKVYMNPWTKTEYQDFAN